MDAGSDTLNTGAYEVKSTTPLRLIEKTIPDCTCKVTNTSIMSQLFHGIPGRFAGSVFVNRNAAEYLRGEGMCFHTLYHVLRHLQTRYAAQSSEMRNQSMTSSRGHSKKG